MMEINYFFPKDLEIKQLFSFGIKTEAVNIVSVIRGRFSHTTIIVMAEELRVLSRVNIIKCELGCQAR